MMNSTYENEIVIKTSTWSRDSHGLYDYGNQNTTNQTIKTMHGAFLMRKNNSIMYSYDKITSNSEAESIEPLIEVTTTNSEIKIEQAFIKPCCKSLPYEDANDKLWQSIKSNNNNSEKKTKHSFILKIGTIIRLGRVKYKIQDIHIANQELENKIEKEAISDEEPIDFKNCEIGNDKSTDSCRICLSETSSKENPLISLCKCNGTLKYIHLECLKEWISQKQFSRELNQIGYYVWRNLKCEICKEIYPYSLLINKERFSLVKIDLPKNDNYILIQSLNDDKNNYRNSFVIKPNNLKTQFSVGRGHNMDLRINDISVSRAHATIIFNGFNFELQDLGSKFGTLILVRDSLKIDPVSTTRLQAGRTFFRIKVKNRLFQPEEFTNNSDQKVIDEAIKDSLFSTIKYLSSNQEINQVLNIPQENIFPIENSQIENNPKNTENQKEENDENPNPRSEIIN